MQNGQKVQWTGRAHSVVVFTVKFAMVQQETKPRGLEYHRSRVYIVEYAK
jgi:hypothetical protein